MNITILYYDESVELDVFRKVVKDLQAAIGNESKVIGIPKNYDVLLDCSLDQLVSVRAIIDTAISLKIEAETPLSSASKHIN